jgi:hypothetical protein
MQGASCTIAADRKFRSWWIYLFKKVLGESSDEAYPGIVYVCHTKYPLYTATSATTRIAAASSLASTHARDAQLWLLIIWYSKFSIEMLQSGPQILWALRLEDQ